MPNRDGTGPEGKGSKTGRQLGKCKDTEPQEFPKERGIGRRAERGRRCRNC